MLGFVLRHICSSQLTVLRSRKTVRFASRDIPAYNPPINFRVILLATLRHVV